MCVFFRVGEQVGYTSPDNKYVAKASPMQETTPPQEISVRCRKQHGRFVSVDNPRRLSSLTPRQWPQLATRTLFGQCHCSDSAYSVIAPDNAYGVIAPDNACSVIAPDNAYSVIATDNVYSVIAQDNECSVIAPI